MSRAQVKNGARMIRQQTGTDRRAGFTLLEMCIVLLIILLLFGVTMPAIQSAFVEQALRQDSHQFALMVKTAMIQSAEQHRPYVMEMNSASVSLHPLGEVAKDPDDPANQSQDDAPASTTTQLEDVTATDAFNAPNKLLVADLDKKDTWIDMPQTTWTFRPGALCPATTIRMSRGDSWVQMDFTPLTGNVENETAYFP